MAITPEQEADLEFQKALEASRNEIILAADTARMKAQAEITTAHEAQRAANLAAQEAQRAENQAAEEAKRANLELVRLAKEILVENRRTKTPAEAEDITAEAIAALASELAPVSNS
jgi:hypothetical protein